MVTSLRFLNASTPSTSPLRGGRVVPVSGQDIENGIVLIEGGKIKAVGRVGEVYHVRRGAFRFVRRDD
jgi:imidazolonepropionase-like amidohydrolase